MIFPVCMACALALVDAGVLVRDRIAVSQAATRAAAAQMVGESPREAALGALPDRARASARIRVRGSEVVVVASGNSRIAKLVRHPVELRSSATFA